MHKSSVVITGLGLVTPIGLTIKPFWSNLIQGHSGIHPVNVRFDGLETIMYAAQVSSEDFNPKPYLKRRKQLKLLSRQGQFAVAAAKMAYEDAGLSDLDMDPERIGISLGTLFGQPKTKSDINIIVASRSDTNHAIMDTVKYCHYFAKNTNPIDTLKSITNLIACQIAIELDARGHVTTFIDSCIASAQAIGNACQKIKRGEADIMIAGGSESSIVKQCMIDNFLLFPMATSRDKTKNNICRPFDAMRRGFIPGEGAAMVVLEKLENAEKRHARVYGHLAGYGMSRCPVASKSNKGAPSVVRSMKCALQEGGFDTSVVDYINANGDGTVDGDLTETIAIKKVFGANAYNIPVSSTKAITGHLLSASSALELIVSVLAIKKNMMPPTINYTHPDPKCDLDYVPQYARERELKIVLSNSIGWFGQSASLIVEKCH